MVLERELGIRKRDGEIGALMGRLEVSGTHARLLLMMYAAKGRIIGRDELMCELHTPTEGNMRATIFTLRQAIGSEAIHNIKYAGYGLTPTGMSMVLAALQPPEMQPDHPLDDDGVPGGDGASGM